MTCGDLCSETTKVLLAGNGVCKGLSGSSRICALEDSPTQVCHQKKGPWRLSLCDDKQVGGRGLPHIKGIGINLHFLARCYSLHFAPCVTWQARRGFGHQSLSLVEPSLHHGPTWLHCMQILDRRQGTNSLRHVGHTSWMMDSATGTDDHLVLLQI